MFALKGVIRLPKESLAEHDIDDFTLTVIDAGADDVVDEPEGLTISSETARLTDLTKALADQGFASAAATLEFVPTTKIQLDQSTESKLNALIEELEAHEDVDAVFTNAE
jgi:transcriptional/translational regulatory protein YebC/TACO1